MRAFHQAVAGFVPPPGAVWHGSGTWSPGLIIAHNDAATYNAAWHQGKLTGFFDWDFAGPATPAWDLAFAAFSWVAPARPARCRRRGVHRLHGQAPPARPVSARLWLVSNCRTVPRCGPGARHGPRRRHPRPRRLGRPGVRATPPPGHPRRPRPGCRRTSQLPAIARSANSVASAARQVSACPSRNVLVTGCQSPGSSGPSQASAGRLDRGVRVGVTGQVPGAAAAPSRTAARPRPARRGTRPDRRSRSPRRPRGRGPASRACTARPAPMASWVRNAGSFFPLTGPFHMRSPGPAWNKIVNLHTIHILCTDRRHVPWFCLSRTAYGNPRAGRLRPRAGKVAAMRQIRDVHDARSTSAVTRATAAGTSGYARLTPLGGGTWCHRKLLQVEVLPQVLPDVASLAPINIKR